MAFRVICAGDVPDHSVIARFRASAGTAAAEALFAEVLRLCARLGMGQVGVIAVDGMKIAASASKSANRTRDGLRRLAAQLAAEHAANDVAEDDRFGPGRRGDEVPPEVADPATLAGRVAAALAELEAEDAAERAAQEKQGQAYLDAAAAGKPGPPPGQVAVAAARARLERARAARQAQVDDIAAGRKPPRRRGPPVGVEDYCLVRLARQALEQAIARAAAAAVKAAAADAGRGPVRNITDPDSRLMPTRGGFIQGCNAQNVTSSDGLIIATTLTADTTDTAWYQPMIEDAVRAAALLAAARPPAAAGSPAAAGTQIGLVLADAGYLSEDNLAAAGPDRLIATGKHRALERTARQDPGARPRRPSPAITAMTARLAAPAGITAYRQRSHIAETPHGHIKHNLGYRQLTTRGTTRTAAERTLVCAIHNLLKTITAGHLTPAALAT